MSNEEVLVPLVIFASIAYIVKIVSDNHLRRFLAKEGQINDDLQYLYAGRMDAKFPASLKWGLVLVALGLAILISRIFGGDEMLMVSLMFLFGGAALIAFYVFAARLAKKQQDEPRR